jgi:hypothetical protein
MRRLLVPAVAVAVVLGVPMLVLQRWVAETRFAAIVLVLAWMLLVGVGAAAIALRRPRLRLPVFGTWALVVVATVAIGYATGFRDMRVDEDVAMASMRADEVDGRGSEDSRRPQVAVELARGTFDGVDGHAGSGMATAIEQPGGARVLTFTEFDVDPGVDVDVYLTTAPDSIDDRVELGDLKGNVGDQQYEIPTDTDLRRYRNVILWCKPFTVRIAVATLG